MPNVSMSWLARFEAYEKEVENNEKLTFIRTILVRPDGSEKTLGENLTPDVFPLLLKKVF